MASKSNEPTNWVGWIFFAGFMMILSGFFNVLAGISALFNDTWFVTTPSNFLFFDLTTWGWYHLIVGFIVLMAGFSVMKGSMWARVVGVMVSIVSAVGAMAMVNVYPIWSILFLTVDLLIIYALTVHGGELKEAK
jgi:hypothetical protein